MMLGQGEIVEATGALAANWVQYGAFGIAATLLLTWIAAGVFFARVGVKWLHQRNTDKRTHYLQIEADNREHNARTLEQLTVIANATRSSESLLENMNSRVSHLERGQESLQRDINEIKTKVG